MSENLRTCCAILVHAGSQSPENPVGMALSRSKMGLDKTGFLQHNIFGSRSGQGSVPKGMNGDPMKKVVAERIQIRMGDLTQIEADAIVNAANPTLLGGEGVDGMIHWAAGEQLLEECRGIGRCPTGEARITKGYNLPCHHVIHTVGPVYKIDGADAPALLASCYRNSLRLAVEHGLATVAFPAISCGAYGYPAAEACRIAINTVWAFLETDDTLQKVIFVLYRFEQYELYIDYFKSRCDVYGL
jgi:O-acetyl-ADP-ribose deacetylase